MRLGTTELLLIVLIALVVCGPQLLGFVNPKLAGKKPAKKPAAAPAEKPAEKREAPKAEPAAAPAVKKSTGKKSTGKKKKKNSNVGILIFQVIAIAAILLVAYGLQNGWFDKLGL